MVLELEGAQGMGDALDGVRLPVGEVVGRIDAPVRAGARMFGMADAIEHGIPHVDVSRRHVDPGAEHARAVGKFAGAHTGEQVEALVGGAVAPGTVGAGLRKRAAALADLVRREIVDIGVAGADQVPGPLVQALEVVRREIEMLAPVESEPADVPLDRVDVLVFFPGGIGVVEPHVATAAEVPPHPEIQADGFGVADMEISVGLRREPGDDGLDAPRGQVAPHDVPDEVARPLVEIGFRDAHGFGLRGVRSPGRGPSARPSSKPGGCVAGFRVLCQVSVLLTTCLGALRGDRAIDREVSG